MKCFNCEHVKTTAINKNTSYCKNCIKNMQNGIAYDNAPLEISTVKKLKVKIGKVEDLKFENVE